jgi:ethanolamine utilization microcompartment shell protein EutS
MRKKIFSTMLIVLVISVTFLPAKTTKGHVNYQKVKKFMEDYYNDYNMYAQDAATIDLMDRYWAPEFLSIQFLPVPQYPILDLIAWKNFLVMVHLNLLETITVEELAIDTKNLTVSSRLSITFNDRFSGALVLHVDAIAFYNLKIVRKNKLKMTFLKLYFANPEAVMAISGPPPGM